MDEHELAMVEAINAARAGRGVHALVAEERLAEAARGHAADLRDNPLLIASGAYHTGSDGSTIVERVARCGYAAEQYGEVTGWGFGGDVGQMVAWWLNSPTHAAYVLAEEMTDIGVGYEAGGAWGHYWTVDFGRPMAPTLPPRRPYSSYAPVVVGAPTPAAGIDLLEYLCGDGRAYRVGNQRGTFEVMQTQAEGDRFYQVKAWDDLSVVHWEEFIVTEGHIGRDVDTSPGGGRFYRQFGAAWVRRMMRVGESVTYAKRVQFYRLSDCAPLTAYSGEVADTIRLMARHERYTFPARDWSPVTLEDVIELRWSQGGERYWYARGYGLVGWAREHSDPNSPVWSAISEMRPDVGRLTRMRIDCL